jgi:hypothetical protein
LQDPVAFHHLARLRIEAWNIQRMRRGPDQVADRTERQPRIGVERDDVAHAARHIERGAVRSA